LTGRYLRWPVLLFLILAVLVVLPIFISKGSVSLVIEMMIMAVAACGLNIIMGYTGMVSFGPAGLYAVGAYTTALLLVRADLPFGLAFVAGPVGAAVVGVVMGWFCVRRTFVYFALLTLAFSQIIYAILFQWYGFTGGDNGIVGIRIPAFLEPLRHYYYFTLIIMVLCLAAMWIICHSAFGRTLQTIRENADRAEFIGINVRRYQLAAFVLSSFFLGAAGSLYCGFNHNVFPNYAHWVKGGDMLVVCLMGGMYNFFGPVLGAVVYILIDKVISAYTEYWPLVLGVIVVLMVMFLRNGIAGFISERFSITKRSGGGSS
jgi:branched-chain amino acid transport system permease protein